MRVVVLGANGGVGRRAVAAAAAAGHEVVAAARTPLATAARRVLPVVVDVRDGDAVRRAVEGVEGILWCVGVTRSSGPGVGAEGLPHVVAAAEEFGVGRLVSVSGAGVRLPGDQKQAGARFVSALTRRLAADLVTDKEAEHVVLAASRLDWTEVRPPRLTDQEGPENWRLVQRAPGVTARPVTKLDVARAMLHLLQSSSWVRQSPFLVAR